MRRDWRSILQIKNKIMDTTNIHQNLAYCCGDKKGLMKALAAVLIIFLAVVSVSAAVGILNKIKRERFTNVFI
jgi:hypothetical protein